MNRWELITQFGESAFLLPCACFLYAWMRWHGATGVARHWMLAFTATALVVLASKLAFMGWGIGSASLDFTGFSGHAMMAASILPVICYIAMPDSRPGLGLLAALGGVLLALAVGVSRLALHAHSVSEVVSGLALGFLVSLPIVVRHGVPRSPRTMLAMCVLLAALMALPTGGLAGASHVMVQELAMFLSGRDRPYHRGEWAALLGTRMHAAGVFQHPPR
ncbi:phosphatase PAP2 family protein [Cupriavidus pauculus]|uniref:Phosphatase n=1 Tax=Cupriavidus pauculus TaxID=82633 RepID=A0A2N5C4B4_9BURK|nr:phosphatase PAP2 family protein [Cupriavidus pauculus]PLP97054.1 phosphatase [Cupriavidus pauculus]